MLGRIAWHGLGFARPEMMTGCYLFDARPDDGREAMGAWVFQRPGWPAQIVGEHVLGSSHALLVHLVGFGREEVAAALLEDAVPQALGPAFKAQNDSNQSSSTASGASVP